MTTTHYTPTEIDAKVRDELGADWLGVKLSRYYITMNSTLGIGGQQTQATTLERSIALAKATEEAQS